MTYKEIEYKRKIIKKTIRELIKKDDVLKQVLKQQKVTGDFIKEVTERAIKCDNNRTTYLLKNILKLNSPINQLLYWCDTKYGHQYWKELDEKYQKIKSNIEKSI